MHAIIIGGEGRQEVTRHHEDAEQQQYFLHLHLAGQGEHRRACAYADGVGRDEMPRYRDADVEIFGKVGEDGHHHKFGNAQS